MHRVPAPRMLPVLSAPSLSVATHTTPCWGRHPGSPGFRVYHNLPFPSTRVLLLLWLGHEPQGETPERRSQNLRCPHGLCWPLGISRTRVAGGASPWGGEGKRSRIPAWEPALCLIRKGQMPANQTAWRHPPGAPHPVSAVRDEGQGWSRRLSRLRSSRGAAWGWRPPSHWPEPAWSPPRGRCPGCSKRRHERGEPWVHRGCFLGIPAHSSLSPISAPPSLHRARPALPRAAPKPAGKGRKALFRAERRAVQEDRLLLLAEIPSCRGGLLREAPHLPVHPLRGTAGSPSQHPWVQAPWGAGWGLPSHSHRGVAPSIFSSAAEAPNNVLRLLPQESC